MPYSWPAINIGMGKGGGRTWARTKDPLIKSQLLYQLSYASIRWTGGGRTWARTKDPLIKSQLLYQLSYASVAWAMGRAGLADPPLERRL